MAAEVVDRGEAAATYAVQSTRRRAADPRQTAYDLFTWTVALESGAATLLIAADAEVYSHAHRCGSEFECRNNVVFLPDKGITLGHTVWFENESTPSAVFVMHELQHVYDVESLPGGVYGSYLALSAACWCYEGNYPERRADGREMTKGAQQGIAGDAAQKIAGSFVSAINDIVNGEGATADGQAGGATPAIAGTRCYCVRAGDPWRRRHI